MVREEEAMVRSRSAFGSSCTAKATGEVVSTKDGNNGTSVGKVGRAG